VKSFDIGDGYVNINTPEDIAIAEQEHAERYRVGAGHRS
jgi:hypothetical protein